MSDGISRSERRNVTLLGLGHLGSVAAGGWTSLGYHVIGWDRDPQLRDSLRDGRGPIVEPGLQPQLRDALGRGALDVVDHPGDALGCASLVHVTYDCYATEEDRIDHDRLDEALRFVVGFAPAAATVMVSSQVCVGTCRGWVQMLREVGRSDVKVAYVPENLRLGAAVEDFRSQEVIVVGADDDETRESVRGVVAPLGRRLLWVSLPAAELVKETRNAYLAMCIVLANDVATIASHYGASPREVMNATRADARVSDRAPLNPGAAFSGTSLRRDLAALTIAGRPFGCSALFEAVLKANDRHGRFVREALHEELPKLDSARIAVLGLTFKGGTSTLRGSLPMQIIRELLSDGAQIIAFDPVADLLPSGEESFQRAPDVDTCVDGADAVLVLSDVTELVDMHWDALTPAKRLVVDGCGVLDAGTLRRAGWRYRGLEPG
jgi:UDPglucose 6-dehydrogenase